VNAEEEAEAEDSYVRRASWVGTWSNLPLLSMDREGWVVMPLPDRWAREMLFTVRRWGDGSCLDITRLLLLLPTDTACTDEILSLFSLE
jgi:hypothetical protein